MLIGLLCTDPLRWIFVEHVLEQINAVCTVLDFQILLQRWLVLQDLLHNLHLGVSSEWRLVGHHHVENDAGRPDIAFLIVLFEQDLGSHIVGRSYPF